MNAVDTNILSDGYAIINVAGIKNYGSNMRAISKHYTAAGENYQESESSVESPLPMICTRKIYF